MWATPGCAYSFPLLAGLARLSMVFGGSIVLMRGSKILRNVLAVTGVVWLFFLLFTQVKSTMTLSFPWIWQEKSRVAAPSGAYDLVVYEGNRGAMSSFKYACFLARHGERIDPNTCDPYEPVLVCSRIRPDGRWENNSHLIIRFEGGPVFHHRPYSQEFNVAIDVEGGPPFAKSP